MVIKASPSLCALCGVSAHELTCYPKFSVLPIEKRDDKVRRLTRYFFCLGDGLFARFYGFEKNSGSVILKLRDVSMYLCVVGERVFLHYFPKGYMAKCLFR